MKKFVDKFNNFMSFLGVICLCGFIVSVMIQVISRTFLPTSPAWTEEMARYLFIYMVAVGSSAAVRKKEFVSVELISGLFSEKINKILSYVINIIVIFFSGYLLIFSVFPFANIQYRMVSTAMQIPMQYIYYSMIVFFVLLVLSHLFEIILIITNQDD